MKHVIKVRDFHNNLIPVEADVKGGIAIFPYMSTQYSVTHVISGCAFNFTYSKRKAKQLRERLLGVALGGVPLAEMAACEILSNAPLIAWILGLKEVDMERTAIVADILACEVKP